MGLKVLSLFLLLCGTFSFVAQGQVFVQVSMNDIHSPDEYLLANLQAKEMQDYTVERVGGVYHIVTPDTVFVLPLAYDCFSGGCEDHQCESAAAILVRDELCQYYVLTCRDCVDYGCADCCKETDLTLYCYTGDPCCKNPCVPDPESECYPQPGNPCVYWNGEEYAFYPPCGCCDE